MTFLPEDDRKYLADKAIVYEEHVSDGQRGVVFPRYTLPSGRFDAGVAKLLILIPAGYADLPPDMFYTSPWLRLVTTNGYPSKADVAHNFLGQSWQRWSRHNNDWRPGIDGIWTMLKRVDYAIASAAA